MAVDMETDRSFTRFVENSGPRLQRALCVALGREIGLEATAEALSYGWEHWERIEAMDNPAGYLYRVGRTSVRREFRWRQRNHGLMFDPVGSDRMPWVESRLPEVISRLTEHQRLAVVLRHAFDWSYREVAELLGISISTVQQHEQRGLRKLRAGMGVTS